MSKLQRTLSRYVPVTAEPNIAPDRRPVLPDDVIGLLWGKGSSFDFSHGTIRDGPDDDNTGFSIKLAESGEPIKRRIIYDVEVQIERATRSLIHEMRDPGDPLPGEDSKATMVSLSPTDIFWTLKITLPRQYLGQAREPTRLYDYRFEKVSIPKAPDNTHVVSG